MRGRVPLCSAFNKVWARAPAWEIASDAPAGGLHENAAQQQLRKITPINRQALLLTTVERLLPAETEPDHGRG